jgi:asparagine synthase (glutamine-hydrolysing)
MCGIAGIFSSLEVSSKQILDMTLTLAHRGPDAQGIYISPNKRVALGHRRLSVLDLSESANQPMTSSNGRYVISFNGEIYNFKEVKVEIERITKENIFRTNSDTEVIIQAFDLWGAGMVNRLEGMFAIAIYDQVDEKLWLFRDRLGKKPLFYFVTKDELSFASEIKALVVLKKLKPQDINQFALRTFLHIGYIPEPNTIWSTIYKLPAGHYAYIDRLLTVSLISYWKPSEHIEEAIITDEISSLLATEKSLEKAIEKRLISDVPLGAFLSGGTDSSLVCAMASKLVPQKLQTFNIGFEETEFNESHYAEKIAAKLGTEHFSYQLKEMEALHLVEKYLHQVDEPFADSSTIPTMLVSQYAKQKVTVALTGDGGDELFLGYGTYQWAKRVQAFGCFFPKLAVTSTLPRRLAKVVNLLMDRVPSDEIRGHIFSQEQGFFSQRELDKLLIDQSIERFKYNDIPDSFLSAEEKQAFFDLKYYLKDDLLVKVDRASMLYSLECRCPLLDHHFVELALQLPLHFKYRKGVRKYLLKKLLSRHLPSDLVHRPKQGFGIPLAKWLKRDLHYMIKLYLSKEVIDQFKIVDFSQTNKLLNRFDLGEDHLYHRIWVLVVLHFWLSKNVG